MLTILSDMHTQKYQTRRIHKTKYYFLVFTLYLLPTLVFGAFSAVFLTPLAVAQEYDPRPYQADKLLQLGIRQHTTGQFQASLKSLQDALKIYRSIPDLRGEATCLGRLAETFFSLGEYRNSIGLRRQQLLLLSSLGDLPEQVSALNDLGNAYLQVGQDGLAQEAYQLAQTIKREIGNPKQEAAFLGNVGLGYEAAGEYQQAIEFHTSQLKIARDIRDLPLQAYSLKNLGEAYAALGQYPQAIEFYQQQLLVARQLKDASLENNALNRLAAAYEALGQYDQAVVFYQQQLELATKAGDATREAYFLRQLGQAYSALGQHQQAIDLYQQQLGVAQKSGNVLTQGTALNNLGRAYLKANNLPEAQKTLQESTQVWQAIRAKLGNNVDYAPEQARTYQLLQQVLIAQNQPTAALEMSEVGNTQAFLELLGMRLKTETVGTGLPIAPPEIAPLTLSEIQQIAKQQKATLVKYAMIADEGIYVWVIPPTGEVTFRKIDPKEQNTIFPVSTVEEVVASIPEALGVKGNSGATQPTDPKKAKPPKPLLQLHQLLIKPIADLLPQKDPTAQVIFIPPKELLQVPFVALVDVYGTYLLEKHTIAIAPAIQVLDLTHKQREKTAGGQPVVVGNPTMPQITAAVGQPPQPLPARVSGEQEARELAQLLKTKTLFIGNQATKAAILPQLGKAKIAHLATYGILDDFKRQGVPGAIAFAPLGTDSGLLTAREILDLYTQPKGKRLRSELIVLSFSETGGGKISGDGILGLSLSLMSAGVPSVIMPLWSNPDTPTTPFMQEFYTQLRQKNDKAQALRQAMLKMKEQNPDPKDWAAFILLGETH